LFPVLLFIDLSSRLRFAEFFSVPNDGLRPLNVAVFVQLVNTLFGCFPAGNERCKAVHLTRTSRGESMHAPANRGRQSEKIC